VTIGEVGTVCFVGAGTMGCANSLVAAVSGYDVVLQDLREASLDAVAGRHEGMAAFMVQSGYASREDIEAGRRRVSLVTDLADATAKADLVSESVFEDLELKRGIHRQLDEVAPSHTILTTNSSALLVSDIEDVVRRGDLFAALHSHLGSPLFDIVGGPRTAPQTIDILRRYVLSLGGVPLVLKKEHPGYVFNALNGPLLAAALRLVLSGRATQEEVDRAWMADRGAPMGPFGMMDLFGLDLVLDRWRHPSNDADREALRTDVVPLLSRYVEAGNLGQKSGRGFYDYPAPAFQSPEFLEATSASAVASDALLAALVRSAVSLVTKDVATREDVDLAWRAATGLDIGPFGIIGRLGVEAVQQVLKRQVTAGLLSPAAADATEVHLREQSG
jgi:3-hydroxybutyryl-CoA dehydrogenase